jgi:UDP-glucose 4-epimerase
VAALREQGVTAKPDWSKTAPKADEERAVSVLVTGGAGYIGSHMVLALRDRGQHVVVVDNLSTGFESAIPSDVAFVNGNVGDAALMEQVIAEHQVDAIAHFAASIVVPESVSDPLGYYTNNTVRTTSLIGAAVKGGVKRFVFSSTAAVYGTPTTDKVDEDSPTNPESPYGASKLMSERVLKDTAFAHGLKVAILRYFNVAGADPAGRTGQSFANATHLIKVCVQAALGRRSHVQVYGTDYPTRDGSGVRDYIHVSDLIDAHVLALDHLHTAHEPLLVNCGYGQGFSVREVIDAVKRVSGVDFQVIESPRRAGDPASIVATGQKARALLGWQPKFDDLDQIVAHALRWEQGLGA